MGAAMIDIIIGLLPDGTSPGVAAGFLALSFVASMLTATLSLGGGVLMLAGLSLAFAPAVVIPLHGLIQLGSNAGRAVIQRAFIQWPLVLWFGAGTVLGSLVGGRVAVALPEQVFGLLIALFILYSVWGPQPKADPRHGPVRDFATGAAISALGMVIGVTGVLVATFLRTLKDRRQIVATHAMLVTISNISKVGAFALFGFAFGQYLPLALAMIATGLAGTALGSVFLNRLPETAFRLGFRLLLTLVALDLLRRAVLG